MQTALDSNGHKQLELERHISRLEDEAQQSEEAIKALKQEATMYASFDQVKKGLENKQVTLEEHVEELEKQLAESTQMCVMRDSRLHISLL